MSAIELTSGRYRITEIKCKTRAKVFEDWRVSDIIRFSTVMASTSGASGGGNYASYFDAENITQGTVATKSQTEMCGMFGKYGAFEMNRTRI